MVCLTELNERCLVPKVVSKGQTYGEGYHKSHCTDRISY